MPNPYGNPGVWGTAGTPPPPRKKKPGTTPRPVVVTKTDPFEARISAYFKPQLDAIERERQARASYFQRLMQNLSGFTSALGPLLSGIPGAVRGAYDSGASTMRSAGSGYGGLLNADQAANAAAANAQLEAIDSPARLSGGDAGGVLAGVAGWLPSEMLKQTGGAWGARAENFPTEAALQANLIVKDLVRQAAEEDKGFSDKVLEVLAQKPELRAQLEAQQQEAQLAQRKAALSELKSERDWYLKQQALALSQGKYDLAQQAAARAEETNRRLANASAGLDYWGNPKPGYRVNPNTGLVEKVPTPKKTKPTKTWTEAYPSFQSKVRTTADAVLTSKGELPGNLSSIKALERYLLNVVAEPFLAQYPASREQVIALVRAEARRIFNSRKPRKGTTKPGASGGGSDLSDLLD